MADYALYHGADLPGNPGDAITSWPSALPGGPALNRITGSGTVQVDAAGLRLLRFLSVGEYRTPVNISVPSSDVVSLGALGANAQVVLSRKRYPNTPAEYHLTHEPSVTIYPTSANFLQMNAEGTIRVPNRVIVATRRQYPYSRQGGTAMFMNGLSLPPRWVRESTLGPTTFDAPLSFWWDAANTSDLYAFAITDPWTSIADRHALLSAWCTQYQTPYRGATPICWDVAMVGGAPNTTYTSLTVIPTATWQANRRVFAFLSLGSQIPATEPITPPPGWALLAEHRPSPQPPAGWGSRHAYTRVLTGTEGPQTWQWTTPGYAALLTMVWGTEESRPPAIAITLAPLGSYDATATSVILHAQAPPYSAILWILSWWHAYYNVPFPTDDATGLLRPGAFNVLNAGISVSGTGTQPSWSTTWTWASGVRGTSGVVILSPHPDRLSGLRAGRMGILAAPRPRRRPGPG
jgi:hypothetical protein